MPEAEETFLFFVTPSQPSVQLVPAFFCGVETAGARNYHLPPSSAEVKNEWSYTFPPPPPVYIQGVDRKN